MAKYIGPLSGTQVRNQEKTLGQVGGTTETWANHYLNTHPCGQEVCRTWEDK